MPSHSSTLILIHEIQISAALIYVMFTQSSQYKAKYGKCDNTQCHTRLLSIMRATNP